MNNLIQSQTRFPSKQFQIEFRVRVLGTPKPSIQWYKDDAEIFSCDRIEMKEEEEGGAVILKVINSFFYT